MVISTGSITRGGLDQPVGDYRFVGGCSILGGMARQNDDETPWPRQLLVVLVALVAVALVIGGVMSVLALGAAKVTGIDHGAAEPVPPEREADHDARGVPRPVGLGIEAPAVRRLLGQAAQADEGDQAARVPAARVGQRADQPHR